jgi:hypothetical protein
VQASNDNRSNTVLDLFMHATTKFGMPSHVQGDHGGENIDLATYMIKENSPCQALFIWGP